MADDLQAWLDRLRDEARRGEAPAPSRAPMARPEPPPPPPVLEAETTNPGAELVAQLFGLPSPRRAAEARQAAVREEKERRDRERAEAARARAEARAAQERERQAARDRERRGLATADTPGGAPVAPAAPEPAPIAAPGTPAGDAAPLGRGYGAVLADLARARAGRPEALQDTMWLLDMLGPPAALREDPF